MILTVNFKRAIQTPKNGAGIKEGPLQEVKGKYLKHITAL